MRCSTHDQSKEKDLWLRPQHLLDMTSKSAYTVVATGIHTASTTNFRCYPGEGGGGVTHSILGFPQVQDEEVVPYPDNGRWLYPAAW